MEDGETYKDTDINLWHKKKKTPIPTNCSQLELKYLFLQAFDSLAMGLLSGLQSPLCLELTVSQTICFQIQLLVMVSCHLQEALCMRVLQLRDLGLMTVNIKQN